MEKQEPRRGLVGGAILVVIGVIALIGRLVPETYGANFGSLILLGLAGVFLVAGIVTRESGWFVPTGILGGLGAGVALITSRLMSGFTLDDGGVFLLCFAAGWFAIPILSVIFTRDRNLWALIPGAIIGLVGLAVALGGVYMNMLQWLNYVWPVALVVIGAWLLYRAYRPREKDASETPVEKQA